MRSASKNTQNGNNLQIMGAKTDGNIRITHFNIQSVETRTGNPYVTGELDSKPGHLEKPWIKPTMSDNIFLQGV